jgi:hypothetical protein
MLASLLRDSLCDLARGRQDLCEPSKEAESRRGADGVTQQFSPLLPSCNTPGLLPASQAGSDINGKTEAYVFKSSSLAALGG